MKKFTLIIAITIYSAGISLAQNVGISTTSPAGKLHIEGTSDNSQLVIDANTTQSNSNPLIRLRNSSNQDLLWIHSNHTSNSFVGRNAGQVVNTGFDNSFFGNQAGAANTSADNNTAIGSLSLAATTSGSHNTAVGYNTLNANTTGQYNCAVGINALAKNTDADDNVAVGDYTMYDNTVGHDNVAIGSSALKFNVAGSYTVAIGAYAMFNANNTPGQAFTTGNVAVGFQALKGSPTPANNTGKHNTAIGNSSMLNNESGEDNTAVGSNTLIGNTTGVYNTAIGKSALSSNTTGGNNTAVGNQALDQNTGNYNSATGSLALENNSTGHSNVANGYQSLAVNTTGFGNTAIGAQSIFSNTTGSNNTAIGKSAYFTTNNLSNTTAIGYLSGGVVNTSNRVEIGNSSVSWVGGQMNWGTYSDGRIKDNVREDVPGLDFINRLRPVTYNLNIHRQNEMVYQEKGEEETWSDKFAIEQLRITGFIAQEVEAAAHEINYDFSGVQRPPQADELYSLRYAEFVMPLVKSVQELSRQNEELRANTKNQNELIENLALQVQTLTKLCQEIQAKGKEY